MKICLVGPGIMPIPPIGWGAVEILIWDYYCELKKKEIDVVIVNKIRNSPMDQMNPNTTYCQELIKEINDGNYYFVHIHYDVLFHIAPYLKCLKIGLTSHYPYIDNETKHRGDGFNNIFNYMINDKNSINFVLATKDIDFMIKKGVNKDRLFKLENGVNIDNFNFSREPALGNKTIYLGKITDRKGQHKYCNLDNIDIIGPDGNHLKNWKGEWTREDVFSKLTNYGNLLLLSDGEADPLVVKEALICGLGVVVNKTSSKNLQQSEFITIIDDNDMNNLNLIQEKIEENRVISLNIREKIRKYGGDNFGWNNLIKTYLNNVGYYLT